jgi:GntR family transcriptional regulator, transcriptional repressor for pyruvate dehydrogenase complex
MALNAKQKDRPSGTARAEKPLNVMSRRDNAMARIRELIVRRGLKAGERLPSERQLADQFRLGRSTVREALQFLAALNLVEIRHGGGCFVCADPRESEGLHARWVHWVKQHRARVLETLEVRLGCEVFAARLAARRARPAELTKLVEALRKMKAASDSQDAPAFVQSDVDFHAALMDAAGNGTLQELVGALGKTSIPERAAIAGISGRIARSFDEHCAIYNAVQQSDARAAGLAMQRHLESVRYDVLVHLLGDVDAALATADSWDGIPGQKEPT